MTSPKHRRVNADDRHLTAVTEPLALPAPGSLPEGPADPENADPRLAEPEWQPVRPGRSIRGRLLMVLPLNVVCFGWYFGWLLQPSRIGNAGLFALLLVAEVFNGLQAVGFWWTVAHERVRERSAWPDSAARVDVFVPVYGESVSIVEPTIRAATRMRGAHVQVFLLDDGNSPQMAELAARHGATYVTRPQHTGAKAGNINHALARTSAPYVAVFDCDHVPHPDFLEATLGHLADPKVAFVQTPQYYANAPHNEVAATAWAQQALFFGGIARGRDGGGAMFCCGTNFVFRRKAVDEAGGFPEDSQTEDFELSIALHAAGWTSVYVPEVLAGGLGPEDMAGYTSQQLRWSRGCISAIPTALRAKLPLRLKVQYLLSASYFLSGWTVLIYMLMPLLRILFGVQPIAAATADQFLIHFAPYFAVALGTVALAGEGAYTFSAFTLQSSSFWIGITSTVRAVLRRPGRFVVTPKTGSGSWQPSTVLVPGAMAALLIVVSLYGLTRDQTPGMANSIAFAGLHAVVMLRGIAPALGYRGRTAAAAARRPLRETADAA